MVRKKTRDLLIFPQQFYTYQSLVRKNTEERDKIIHLFTGDTSIETHKLSSRIFSVFLVV